MGYISLLQILDDLKDNPLMDDLDMERVVNYTATFIRKVGCPKLFEDKIAEIKIVDYRGELPCDFVDVTSVRFPNGNSLIETSDVFFMKHTLERKPLICMDKYIKRDLREIGLMTFNENTEISIEIIKDSLLDANDILFLTNHPEIKNVADYVLHKIQYLNVPNNISPHNHFKVNRTDLEGIDEDLKDDVVRILNGWLARFFDEKHNHDHHREHFSPTLVKEHDRLRKVEFDLWHDHKAFTNTKSYENSLTDSTYKIQGNFIFTSFNDGFIEIAYKSIPLDIDGYPMVFDNEEFKEALKYFIKWKCYEIKYGLQKIPRDVFEDVKTEYAWAVGQAQTSLIRLNFDLAEKLKRSWNTLLVNATSHRRGFKYDTNIELLKRH